MSETSDVYAPPAATGNEAAPTPRTVMASATIVCVALLTCSLLSALLLRSLAVTSSVSASVYD